MDKMFNDYGDLAFFFTFVLIFCALFIIMNGIRKIFNICRYGPDRVFGRHTTPQNDEDIEVGIQKASKNSVTRTISVSSAATADTIGAADVKPIVPIRQIPRTEKPASAIRQIPR
jgi:hypothetical protein